MSEDGAATTELKEWRCAVECFCGIYRGKVVRISAVSLFSEKPMMGRGCDRSVDMDIGFVWN